MDPDHSESDRAPVADESDVRQAAARVFEAINQLLRQHPDAVVPLVDHPSSLEHWVAVSVAAAAIRTLAMASGRTEEEIVWALADGYTAPPD